jgi:NAD(P)-dependent dehydrogenase (short-subunit alcohol dehydrogenase family)
VNLTAPTPPISKYPRAVNHAYMASRYALNALTKMIALEWESKGIITVALWPGYISTDMNRDPAAAPVETAIPLAAQVIDSLTADHNGCCLLPDGTRYDW